MRRSGDDARIIFCVDTDTYAGNFERDICAFMTGIVGECGVGEESKRLYEEEGLEPLDDLVDAYVPDEHGCCRPAAIQPTPGWFNTGMGVTYHESNYDEADVVGKHNKAVEDYAKNTCEKVYADKAHGKKEAERFRKEHTIEKIGQSKHFAYNSAGIYLTREPTKEEIALLKERAHKFVTGRLCKFTGEPLNITIEGFRLAVESKAKKERSV